MRKFNLHEFVSNQFGKTLVQVISAFDEIIYELENSNNMSFTLKNNFSDYLQSLKTFLTIFRMPGHSSVASMTWKKEHYEQYGLLIKDLLDRGEIDDTYKIIVDNL